MYILWQTLNQKDIHVKKDGPIVDQDKSTMWGATRSKREYTINTKSTLVTDGALHWKTVLLLII